MNSFDTTSRLSCRRVSIDPQTVLEHDFLLAKLSATEPNERSAYQHANVGVLKACPWSQTGVFRGDAPRCNLSLVDIFLDAAQTQMSIGLVTKAQKYAEISDVI